MLPSSSSQLARYGNISHYKKFWLLQSTQLEKQEQSSSSTTLSLGSSSTAAAAPSSHAIKESSKSSSLIAHHVNGDVQHHAIIAPPQYGICRMDMAGSSSRVNSNGCSAPVFGPNEPANCVSPYFTSMQGYGLQVSNVMSMRGESGGPQLSLAVTCDNMDVIKPVNYKWQSSSTSSQPQCNEQKQQVIASLAGAEEAGSNGCEEEKRVCNGTFAQALAVASAPQLMRIGGQTQMASGFQCRNIPTHDTTPASGLPASSSYLRTCTLCGTTRTPLWRSGPDGPKSLCNACGIRVKKTKRLEAALQATGGSAPSPSTMSAFKGALKRKLSSDAQKDPTFHKKKRSTSIFMSSQNVAKLKGAGHSRKPGGLCDNSIPKVASYTESGRSSANIFAEDVEEGAVLLMALSCGLVLS